jgi:hypothetical protein
VPSSTSSCPFVASGVFSYAEHADFLLQGFGAGGAGGLVGKAEIAGPSGTGVSDLLADASSVSGLRDPPRYFLASDLAVGGTVEFAHAPGQVFLLESCDDFTKLWLSSTGAETPTGGSPLKSAPALAKADAMTPIRRLAASLEVRYAPRLVKLRSLHCRR